MITEFALFNANLNRFAVVTTITEFLNAGKVIPFASVDVIRLYSFGVQEDNITFTIELAFLGLYLFFIIKEIREVGEK